MIALLFFILMFAAVALMAWSGLQLLQPKENPLDERLGELMATRRQNEGRASKRRLGGGFLNSFLYLVALVPGVDSVLEESEQLLKQAGFRNREGLAWYAMFNLAFLIALMIGSWMVQEESKPLFSKILGLAPAFLLGWLLPKQILYRLMKRYKNKLQAALPDTVDHFGGFMNIGPTIEYVERAFDAAKYGWYSERPFIDAAIQSVVDPDMAPPGKHVMSCFVQYAPYELRGSDWETERENFGDKAQAVLESHFPGFGDLVLHREVVTPVDIERVTGLTEGNIFAGEFLAPQMYFFRPAPGWSQYRTPIDGYYQCGSGTHPGGCVIGSPGKLASQRILKDVRKA